MENPYKKAWRVLSELTFYGLIIRSGQLLAILLALQFGQIFTNPAQIIYIFPIAIAIVAILGLLTLVEIECNRYVGALDNRLKVLSICFSLDGIDYQQGYLERTILPVALNILSLPILFLFLAWTSPYLFSILLLSVALSGAVIFRFNNLLQKNSAYNGNELVNKLDSNNSDSNDEIPFYLFRSLESIASKLRTSQAIFQQNSAHSNSIQLKVRKRKLLNLIRQTTRVLVLTTAVILAVLNNNDITKIVGFLLLGNTFRSGFVAIFEFMSATKSIFPLRESVYFLKTSLITNDELEQYLKEKLQTLVDKRLSFDNQYASLIQNKPYLRVKKLTIKDNNGINIALDITSRMLIAPLTFINIPNNALANRTHQFIINYKNDSLKAKDIYLISGEILLGGQKLSNQFFDDIQVYNPSNITIFSLDIYAYFDETRRNELQSLIDTNNDLKLLLDSIVNSASTIEMYGPRKINQFRSILQLIIIYLESSCICVLLDGFDSLDSPDLKTLISIFEPLFAHKRMHLLCLVRSRIPLITNCSYYEFTSDKLLRQINHA